MLTKYAKGLKKRTTWADTVNYTQPANTVKGGKTKKPEIFRKKTRKTLKINTKLKNLRKYLYSGNPAKNLASLKHFVSSWIKLRHGKIQHELYSKS